MLNDVMSTGVPSFINNELFYSVIAKQDSPRNFSTKYENRDPGRGRFIN